MKRYWIVFYTYFTELRQGFGWLSFQTDKGEHINLHRAKKAISKDILCDKVAITNFKEIANESDYKDAQQKVK